MNTFAIYTRRDRRAVVITSDAKPPVTMFGNGSRFIELEDAQTTQNMWSSAKKNTLNNAKVPARVQRQLSAVAV